MNNDQLTQSLRDIIRGLIECARPGTDQQTVDLAWKRAGLVVAIEDKRASDEELMAFLAQIKKEERP